MKVLCPERSQVGIMLIDIQLAFLDLAFGDNDKQKEHIIIRLENLLMLTEWIDLPTIVTFEHPIEENGEFPDRLEHFFPANGQRFTKRTCDCTLEATINQAIKQLPVQQFAVVGAETDVCVMQSVLGLLRMEDQVFLLRDCLFTTDPDPSPALVRMYNSGVAHSTLRSLAYALL